MDIQIGFLVYQSYMEIVNQVYITVLPDRGKIVNFSGIFDGYWWMVTVTMACIFLSKNPFGFLRSVRNHSFTNFTSLKKIIWLPTLVALNFFAKAIDYIDFISIQISLNDTINHEFKIRQHSGTKKKDNANSGPALEGFPCK